MKEHFCYKMKGEVRLYPGQVHLVPSTKDDKSLHLPLFSMATVGQVVFQIKLGLYDWPRQSPERVSSFTNLYQDLTFISQDYLHPL